MDTLKSQYEETLSKRAKVIEQMNSLKKNELVKEYIKLCGQNERLMNQQHCLYTEIKNDEYSSCNHIWVDSAVDYDNWEDRTYRYCGCIKCGLDQSVLYLKEQYYDIEGLTFEQQVMYDFMQNHSYQYGIDTNILCNLDLAKAIYSKIRQVYPEIDDETAIKYFESALNNIRNIEVRESRKVSRAKRLLLTPNFNQWDGGDILR